MSEYYFKTNDGRQITLGEKSNLIKVKIHDSTPAPTPTSLVIDYTADLFRRYSLNSVPTPEQYKAIPEAICPSDILVKTEISDLKDLIGKAWFQVESSRR